MFTNSAALAINAHDCQRVVKFFWNINSISSLIEERGFQPWSWAVLVWHSLMISLLKHIWFKPEFRRCDQANQCSELYSCLPGQKLDTFDLFMGCHNTQQHWNDFQFSQAYDSLNNIKLVYLCLTQLPLTCVSGSQGFSAGVSASFLLRQSGYCCGRLVNRAIGQCAQRSGELRLVPSWQGRMDFRDG